METYKVDLDQKWDYENGFYLTCETGRLGKLLNHLEIYKKILDLPGDVLEFGVYKGTSLVRLLSFRDLLEHQGSRKIVGFDAFGKFPDDLELEEDRDFVERFEQAGGYGISAEDLDDFLQAKGMKNYELVEGDINHSLPNYLEAHPAQKIALLHIDVDVYEPSKLILDLLWERVVPGGILMLDDYGTVAGETQAVDEFFAGQNVRIHKLPHYHIPAYVIKD